MTISILFRATFAGLVAASLSGCIFFETHAQRVMRSDPSFKIGYSDGCATANARGSSFLDNKVRDDALFQSSQPYRAGWSNGYTVCNTELKRSGNTNVNGMPDRRPNP